MREVVSFGLITTALPKNSKNGVSDPYPTYPRMRPSILSIEEDDLEPEVLGDYLLNSPDFDHRAIARYLQHTSDSICSESGASVSTSEF